MRDKHSQSKRKFYPRNIVFSKPSGNNIVEFLVLAEDKNDAFDDPEGKMGMPHDKALNYENFWYNAELKSSQEVLGELKQV